MSDSNALIRVPSSVFDVESFDYGTVSPDVARYLRGHAARLRQYISKSIIQIGKDLLGAKRYLPHGAFLEWVEREAGINPRTAQSYMHAAEWAANKSATVARLPPGLLYVLSAASTPTFYVDEVIRRVETGERLTLAKVRAELKKINEERAADRVRNRSLVVIDHDVSTQEYYTMDEDICAVARTLAATLPMEKFRWVCDVMTSSSVLSRPDLANAIESAFRISESLPV
jgi:hypothetical protein